MLTCVHHLSEAIELDVADDWCVNAVGPEGPHGILLSVFAHTTLVQDLVAVRLPIKEKLVDNY
jgi:hypothetical protein